MHDVLEDTAYTKENMLEEWGRDYKSRRWSYKIKKFNL